MPHDHTPPTLDRRVLLRDLGVMTVGAVLVGAAAACGGDTPREAGTPAGGPTDAGATGSWAAGTPGGWGRVDLGFVSAYVLVRAGRAVVVDTGTEGSADAIGSVLDDAGAGWADVGDVILTHRHPDHVGSLPAVLERAPEATAHAGAADIPAITSPREVAAVGGGDRVADLEIIATPGHTPGHVSVLDPAGDGLLLAGDALNGRDGGVVGADPEFSADMAQADASVRKLAGYDYRTVVFGHGEPVGGGAADAVGVLAASR